jgi:cell division protein FtsN
VYQFYYAIGLYRTAEIKLNQLKADYPQSKYIASAVRADTKNLPEEKQDPPATEQNNMPHDKSPAIQVGTPMTEERESPAQPDEVTVRGQYALQVGAYSQQVNAEKQKLFFEDLGYQVEVINKVQDARSLFVVLVGEYKTADDARAKSAELKKKYNINSMMITR